MLETSNSQDELYREATRAHGAALERLARASQADPDKRQDLLQEIHLALWRSFARFDGRCSTRTWIYRVAHNVAATHVLEDRRMKSRELLSLDELDAIRDSGDAADPADRKMALDRLLMLIQQLKPLDRQVVLMFLEGESAAEIAEVTGISAGNVATKIHRIKNILARRFKEGGAQ
jgi:RNA polymerase sigma-70 factor (ECF subfamily)